MSIEFTSAAESGSINKKLYHRWKPLALLSLRRNKYDRVHSFVSDPSEIPNITGPKWSLTTGTIIYLLFLLKVHN
jgi:hypothetical protein